MRAFYARHDTYTPFWINCIENVVNIALAFPLYAWLGIPGLALAFALAYFVGAIVTLGVLRVRLDGIDGAQIMSSLTRIVAAGVVLGGVSWAVSEFVGWSSFGQAVVAVVAGTAIGGVVYVGLLMLLRVEELSAVRSLIPARLRSRS
jgi:putative peptidoglycan lipid II flippase